MNKAACFSTCRRDQNQMLVPIATVASKTIASDQLKRVRGRVEPLFRRARRNATRARIVWTKMTLPRHTAAERIAQYTFFEQDSTLQTVYTNSVDFSDDESSQQSAVRLVAYWSKTTPEHCMDNTMSEWSPHFLVAAGRGVY